MLPWENAHGVTVSGPTHTRSTLPISQAGGVARARASMGHREGRRRGVPRTEDEERQGEKSKMDAHRARSRGWSDTQGGAAVLPWVRERRTARSSEKIFLCFFPTPFLNSQTSEVM